MNFDHLVVRARDPAEARSHVEDTLGVAMQPGGAHAVFQTHNALMGLEDGLYLEAIAPNPAVAPPMRARWYDLDRFSGSARLSNWACAVTNMDAALVTSPDGAGAPVAVRRGEMFWRMAVSEAGTTPFDNLWPALIEWSVKIHPAGKLAPTGIRLKRFTLIHPHGAALATALARDLADDRGGCRGGAGGDAGGVFHPPRGSQPVIQAACDADAAWIADIWNAVIADMLVTFTTDLKTDVQVAGIIAAQPVLVLPDRAGFATYGPFRTGPGYAATVEHTVLLAPRAQGQGQGRALMQALMDTARRDNHHVMVAGISAANPGAVAFHAAFGFAIVAQMPGVGCKGGQWLDLILMQKTLHAAKGANASPKNSL